MTLKINMRRFFIYALCSTLLAVPTAADLCFFGYADTGSNSTRTDPHATIEEIFDTYGMTPNAGIIAAELSWVSVSQPVNWAGARSLGPSVRISHQASADAVHCTYP